MKKLLNKILDATLFRFLDWLFFGQIMDGTRPYYLWDRIALKIDDIKRKYR